MAKNNKIKSIYSGLISSLATMHQKETVIAPHFNEILNIHIKIPKIDTDLLGTFSGEIERKNSMENTAIKKALIGMQLESVDLGIASEGSFGPHPTIFFIPAGIEHMVFVDNINNIVISESLITEKTNFSHMLLNSTEISNSFLKQVGFPEHALIVANNHKDINKIIFKGITDYNDLKNKIEICYKSSINGEVHIETDMRAHMNPTRMCSIDLLAKKLVKRISNLCHECHSPGFGKISIETGLPCRICFMPTEQIKHKILHCIKCPFKKIKINSKNSYADGSQCQYCNP